MQISTTNKLKLFKSAILQMVRTRLIKVFIVAIIVGFGVTGAFILVGNPPSMSKYIGIGFGLGAIVGQSLREIGFIYNRLKKQQKLDALNNR